MLIADTRGEKVVPSTYYREVTRLGGDYALEKGLAPESMERTLSALKGFSTLLRERDVSAVRVVGTLALRRASNAPAFIDAVMNQTGLSIEVIDGTTEARLSCAGVLSALDSVPSSSIIFDIGGGSTEFVYVKNGVPNCSASFDLGVVALAETCASPKEEQGVIAATLQRLTEEMPLLDSVLLQGDIVLVGTAGTVTTLAALDLGMTEYDWRRVNNHVLTRESLERWMAVLEPLSPNERENLPAIEEGRGDLIVPGLRIVLAIMDMMGQNRLVVSDFGLLEGTLLSLRRS